jgi:hypothetical protein
MTPVNMTFAQKTSMYAVWEGREIQHHRKVPFDRGFGPIGLQVFSRNHEGFKKTREKMISVKKNRTVQVFMKKKGIVPF